MGTLVPALRQGGGTLILVLLQKVWGIPILALSWEAWETFCSGSVLTDLGPWFCEGLL